MRKSEAKKRITGLKSRFERDYAEDILEDTSIRNAWLNEAKRLVADVFGVHDELYNQIMAVQSLSNKYDRETDTLLKKETARRWYESTSKWLDDMSSSVKHGSNFDKLEFQSTKWFAFLYPVLLVLVAAGLSYLNSQRLSDAQEKFVRERIEDENKRELAIVLTEFKLWASQAQVGVSDSIEAIAADFASRGVFRSGGYLESVHKFALRKRFSIDSTRAVFFSRISVLGGDTTSLKAPRKLGIRIDKVLSGVAGNLNINLSHWRLDSL